MFHVFQYGGRREGRGIFFSPKAYMGGGTSTTMSLRVECSRLVFGEVASQTLSLPRPTAVSLQGEFGAYMED